MAYCKRDISSLYRQHSSDRGIFSQSGRQSHPGLQAGRAMQAGNNKIAQISGQDVNTSRRRLAPRPAVTEVSYDI